MQEFGKTILAVALLPFAVSMLFLFGESYIDGYLQYWGISNWMFPRAVSRSIYFGVLVGSQSYLFTALVLFVFGIACLFSGILIIELGKWLDKVLALRFGTQKHPLQLKGSSSNRDYDGQQYTLAAVSASILVFSVVMFSLVLIALVSFNEADSSGRKQAEKEKSMFDSYFDSKMVDGIESRKIVETTLANGSKITGFYLHCSDNFCAVYDEKKEVRVISSSTIAIQEPREL